MNLKPKIAAISAVIGFSGILLYHSSKSGYEKEQDSIPVQSILNQPISHDAMKIEYPHHLSKEQSYYRITKRLAELERAYADDIDTFETKWEADHSRMSFNFEVMGFSTQGHLYLKDNHLILEGELPLLARLFSSKIEEMVKENLDDILTK